MYRQSAGECTHTNARARSFACIHIMIYMYLSVHQHGRQTNITIIPIYGNEDYLSFCARSRCSTASMLHNAWTQTAKTIRIRMWDGVHHANVHGKTNHAFDRRIKSSYVHTESLKCPKPCSYICTYEYYVCVNNDIQNVWNHNGTTTLNQIKHTTRKSTINI